MRKKGDARRMGEMMSSYRKPSPQGNVPSATRRIGYWRDERRMGNAKSVFLTGGARGRCLKVLFSHQSLIPTIEVQRVQWG